MDIRRQKTIPEKLRKLYWIFRARPDILLLTEKSAIWIELKVFSGEPATKIDGYNQYGTQLDIADLAAIAVPRLDKKIKMNLTIQRSGQPIKNGRKYIMWDAIARPTSVFPKSLFKNFVRSNRKSPPGLS